MENAMRYSHGLGKEDPNYQDLMIHSPPAALPLHNYYSEFRLGQGDPLMKAAMEKWPYTSTEDEPVEGMKKPKRKHPQKEGCNILADHTFWFFNDIVHIEKHKLVGSKPSSQDAPSQERRFSH